MFRLDGEVFLLGTAILAPVSVASSSWSGERGADDQQPMEAAGLAAEHSPGVHRSSTSTGAREGAALYRFSLLLQAQPDRAYLVRT
jgi:hypothetical protein